MEVRCPRRIEPESLRTKHSGQRSCGSSSEITTMCPGTCGTDSKARSTSSTSAPCWTGIRRMSFKRRPEMHVANLKTHRQIHHLSLEHKTPCSYSQDRHMHTRLWCTAPRQHVQREPQEHSALHVRPLETCKHMHQEPLEHSAVRVPSPETHNGSQSPCSI